MNGLTLKVTFEWEAGGTMVDTRVQLCGRELQSREHHWEATVSWKRMASQRCRLVTLQAAIPSWIIEVRPLQDDAVVPVRDSTIAYVRYRTGHLRTPLKETGTCTINLQRFRKCS